MLGRRLSSFTDMSLDVVSDDATGFSVLIALALLLLQFWGRWWGWTSATACCTVAIWLCESKLYNLVKIGVRVRVLVMCDVRLWGDSRSPYNLWAHLS